MKTYTVYGTDWDTIEVSFPETFNVPKPIQSHYHYNPVRVQNVLSQFDLFTTTPTTVGTLEGNVYNPEVRNSHTIPIKRLHTYGTVRNRFPQLDEIYPARYHNQKYGETSKLEYRDYRQFQLHCYEPGGFFLKHTDGKKSPRHFATLLIFPPARVSQKKTFKGFPSIYSKRDVTTVYPFEGGDLILYPENSEPVVIQPSKFENWTVVAFHLSVPHECTPVTSGRRFVFKTDLELPLDAKLFTNTKPQTPIKVVVNLTKYEQKIRTYEDKIRKCRNKMTMLSNPNDDDEIVTTKVDSMISDIDNFGEDVAIVLGMSEPTRDPSKLEGEEAALWNAIIKCWPYSSLRTREVEQYEYADELSFKNEDEFGKCKILYWKSPHTHTLGNVINVESKYNDETYDDVNTTTVAIICVQKEKFEPDPLDTSNIIYNSDHESDDHDSYNDSDDETPRINVELDDRYILGIPKNQEDSIIVNRASVDRGLFLIPPLLK